VLREHTIRVLSRYERKFPIRRRDWRTHRESFGAFTKYDKQTNFGYDIIFDIERRRPPHVLRRMVGGIRQQRQRFFQNNGALWIKQKPLGHYGSKGVKIYTPQPPNKYRITK
jgi:hypothetical protein